MPLDDLESQLGTDFKRVRPNHYLLFLSRVSNLQL